MDLNERLSRKIEELDKYISKNRLNEVFVVSNHKDLKLDLINFLRGQFQKGNIKPVHLGLSTTEFKPEDWLEDIADNVVNRMFEYFEVIRGQTERDL